MLGTFILWSQITLEKDTTHAIWNICSVLGFGIYFCRNGARTAAANLECNSLCDQNIVNIKYQN